jgi:hypothetical protein
VDLTADGADVTDKKERESVAADMALSRRSDFAPPRRTLYGVSLIREIRGPFLARLRVGRPYWALRAAA